MEYVREALTFSLLIMGFITASAGDLFIIYAIISLFIYFALIRLDGKIKHDRFQSEDSLERIGIEIKEIKEEKNPDEDKDSLDLLNEINDQLQDEIDAYDAQQEEEKIFDNYQ